MTNLGDGSHSTDLERTRMRSRARKAGLAAPERAPSSGWRCAAMPRRTAPCEEIPDGRVDCWIVAQAI